MREYVSSVHDNFRNHKTQKYLILVIDYTMAGDYSKGFRFLIDAVGARINVICLGCNSYQVIEYGTESCKLSNCT